MNTIGHYELYEVTGEGGMGTVWRGRDPRFDRPVAVKMLHPHLARDTEVLARFKTEAVISAKLNHPNIVTVHDFLVVGDTAAMVMEYVVGRSLEDLLQREGPLGAGRCVYLMCQILEAVEVAHEAGIVHRDLKPSNVLIQELGGRELAKVMDFGVAKVLGTEKLRTATSAKMGTLQYMSPEQVKSPKYVDARSDVYALGVMLYEMATGHLPFEGDTEWGLMQQIVESKPPAPRQRNALVPDWLEQVILKAMAKNPMDRFQSCREFSQAFNKRVVENVSAQSTPSPSASQSVSGERVLLEVDTGEFILTSERAIHTLPGSRGLKRKEIYLDQLVSVTSNETPRYQMLYLYIFTPLGLAIFPKFLILVPLFLPVILCFSLKNRYLILTSLKDEIKLRLKSMEDEKVKEFINIVEDARTFKSAPWQSHGTSHRLYSQKSNQIAEPQSACIKIEDPDTRGEVMFTVKTIFKWVFLLFIFILFVTMMIIKK